MPASAGSRQAALRMTWLSIDPPCVGSGWQNTMTALGSSSSGNDHSPTRRTPSSVSSETGYRRAGRTELAAIVVTEPRVCGVRTTYRGRQRERLFQQGVCQWRRNSSPS